MLGTLSKRRLAAVRRRRVGYVFQELNLLPSLTAVENVALPLELDGTPIRAARRLALAALADLGLADLAKRFPEQLSGGQQQRVAIARALVGQRRLVLAEALAYTWPTFEKPLPYVIPWMNVLMSLVIVPLVAMLGAAILTRGKLPIERSTAG